MRSLVPLDSHDLRELACPWCGRTPQRATFGLKAVRGSAVVGLVAAAPASELGGFYPPGSVVVVQMWVRPEDLGELIGTQLVQRLAATVAPRRGRCLVAGGTRGASDCRHLPAAWLEGLGFVESVRGVQWRLDLRGAIRAPEALKGLADAVGRLARPARPVRAH